MSDTDRLIALPRVEEMTGIKKTMIYRLVRNGKFPKQYKPGGHASRWSEAEVRDWCEAQREQQAST